MIKKNYMHVVVVKLITSSSISSLILLTFLFNTTLATLITEGHWILNSTNRQRVHLKCANWYGGHQELFVVGGLELRSVANLTDLFKSSGANCVRLTYSIEMVKYNPVVKPESIAGIAPSDNCNSTERALGVMDCVVHHMQMRGILIIFNNHNSWAGWVGAGAAKNNDQGLWNLPGYSTEDWIQSLEFLVRRYKISGIDLRNEIHDQGGVRITWGETSNVNTDWRAASTAAYERIYHVDPDILVIVGGLCWNTDLRAMAKKIGPSRAFANKKLVYTVHIYTFTFWWNAAAGGNMIRHVITPYSLLFSFISLLIAGACIFTSYQQQQMLWCSASTTTTHMVSYRQLELLDCSDINHLDCDNLKPTVVDWSIFLSMSIVFHVGWLCLAVFYFHTANAAGCSSFANDSIWLIRLASVLVFCSSVGIVCYIRDCVTTAFVSGLVWLGALFFSIFALGTYLSSNTAYSDSLRSWSLDDISVPVLVGEFGTGTPDEASFKWLWEFIHDRYNLDFAYWAFNGRKWMDGAWQSESYGLANDQYTRFRIPSFIKVIFDS